MGCVCVVTVWDVYVWFRYGLCMCGVGAVKVWVVCVRLRYGLCMCGLGMGCVVVLKVWVV